MPLGLGDMGVSFFSGSSVTRASVVRIMVATEAAFWRAERTTLAGSMIPNLVMEPVWPPLATLTPKSASLDSTTSFKK